VAGSLTSIGGTSENQGGPLRGLRYLARLRVPLADNLPSEYRPHRIEAEGGASCVLHGASLQSDIRDRGADVAQGPLERLREEQRMAACGSAAQVDRFGAGFRRMNGGAACAHSLFKNDLLVASYCAPDVGDRLPEMGARRLCQRLRLGDGIMRERLVPESGAAGQRLLAKRWNKTSA